MVIAGAGSGKTTLMAARVVYLVVTGQVAPEEVLGLTFTTKAASELRQPDPRRAAGGRMRSARRRPCATTTSTSLEPTVATYNAYAANLLTEHGLRIGHEPETRVITDASRYQLGARAVERFTGEVELLSDHPPTVIQNLLALDGAMSEHLVAADDVRALDGRRGGGSPRRWRPSGRARPARPTARRSRRRRHAIGRRAELVELVRPTAG